MTNHNPRFRFSRTAGAILMLALSACAVNPATGGRMFSLVGEGQEIEMGQQAMLQVDAGMGLYDGPALQAYVDSVGQAMAAVSERPELPWSFKVVDDPVINALHLPEAAFAARRWFKKTDSKTCGRCHIKDAIAGSRPATLSIHLEEAEGKTCVDCHYNLVHRPVPDEKTFKRDRWNRMIEKEFNLEPGSTDLLLAD